MRKCITCGMSHAGTGPVCLPCYQENEANVIPKAVRDAAWWKEIRQKSADQGGYRGGTPETDSPRSPLTTHSMGTVVKCKSFGCGWSGSLRDLTAHRKESHP